VHPGHDGDGPLRGTSGQERTVFAGAAGTPSGGNQKLHEYVPLGVAAAEPDEVVAHRFEQGEAAFESPAPTAATASQTARPTAA